MYFKTAFSKTYRSGLLGAALLLSACGGGGGGSSSDVVTPPPAPPPVSQDVVFDDKASASRFLTQATFGAGTDDIDAVIGTRSSDWFRAELAKPATLNLPFTAAYITRDGARNDNGNLTYQTKQAPTFSFYRNAIEGDDQLRQRAAYALSQIFVISHSEQGTNLFNVPDVVSHYQDILVTGAFGNFRDLLEEVTYSPAMGEWLTYRSNAKADPRTGRVPDENYAREIMQLFTIGLVELNNDGTVKLGADGEPVETYDNEDVTGMAKVFTGLAVNPDRFYTGFGNTTYEMRTSRMTMFDSFHSDDEKAFLDAVISPGTGGEQSITIALDTLFEHPNVGPFIGHQMIQRMTTSNPSPAYIDRVATAFNTGRYSLPDDSIVGDGRRGDMSAMIAAIIFDPEARAASAGSSQTFGKVREPVLRFTHWARAFDVSTVTPENKGILWNTSTSLGQHPYKSPSVFNFYRPGYVPPGTQSGEAGLTVPEFQISNTSSVASYANFMTYFAFEFDAGNNDPDKAASFRPDYSQEMAIADDAALLVARLDDSLTGGALSQATKTRIETLVDAQPLAIESNPDYDGYRNRTALAITLIMTSPDYIVQR